MTQGKWRLMADYHDGEGYRPIKGDYDSEVEAELGAAEHIDKIRQLPNAEEHRFIQIRIVRPDGSLVEYTPKNFN